MVRDRYSRLKWVVSVLTIWLACLAIYLALTINHSLKHETDELNEAGFLLHRMISQRVAQHDAHMTTLASLMLADGSNKSQLVAQVGDSIMRYYPRIKDIQEIEITWRDLSATADIQQILSIPSNATIPDYRSLGRDIFLQKAGEVKAYISPSSEHEYLLAKKLKDTNPALAIVMKIAPRQLIDMDELPEWANLKLILDSSVIVEQKAAQETYDWIAPRQFSRVIDSQSQPLLLLMNNPVALAELVDFILLAVIAIISLIVLLLLGNSLQHRHEVRRLKNSAILAEQRSITLAREARLAHAARVNSMGELASGIAHELAQPLTALMSQSRAAERIAEQSGIDNILLKKAMAANVREARRAGDMLKRMRDYISNRPPKPVEVSINNIMHDTIELLHNELEQRSITTNLSLEPELPVLMADPVELEQVFNNLIRNASDSLYKAGITNGQISITTKRSADHISVQICDNGPGIPADLQPRLFEPFFTTKEEGMGLGLTICSTLIERIGGHIEANNNQNGGACLKIWLPTQNKDASA